MFDLCATLGETMVRVEVAMVLVQDGAE